MSMTISQFFAMGGYATFVWGAYGIAAVVLTYNVCQPIWRQRQVIKQLRSYLKMKSQKK
jgi:heme exporter protein D